MVWQKLSGAQNVRAGLANSLMSTRDVSEPKTVFHSMNPFETFLIDLSTEQIEYFPGDPNREARANLCTFSISKSQAARITISDVSKFLVAACRNRAASVDRKSVFYAWVDEAAARLCTGLVSDETGRLPFGAPYDASATDYEIAEIFMSLENHGGIPINEFKDVLDSDFESEPVVQTPIRVFAQSLEPISRETN